MKYNVEVPIYNEIIIRSGHQMHDESAGSSSSISPLNEKNILINNVTTRSSRSNSNTSTSSSLSCNFDSGNTSTCERSCSSSGEEPQQNTLANKNNEELANELAKMSLNENQPTTTTNITTTTNTDSSTNTNNYSTITSLKVHNLYKFQEKIRSGGFGDVYKGVRREDNLPIAIKVIHKDKITSWSKLAGQTVPMEIDLMFRANQCDGCIKIIDYIEKFDRYMIVMERPERCMDLWDFINNKGPLNQNTARIFFKQISNTVIDLKLNGIVHRDIKDEVRFEF
jgi:hypothetical protein